MAISRELLLDFAGALATATDAPDDYVMPELINYERNKADLISFWSQIKPQIKRDIERRDLIDVKLQEAFDAFESGDNERGLDAILAIYNCDVKTLR